MNGTRISIQLINQSVDEIFTFTIQQSALLVALDSTVAVRVDIVGITVLVNQRTVLVYKDANLVIKHRYVLKV